MPLRYCLSSVGDRLVAFALGLLAHNCACEWQRFVVARVPQLIAPGLAKNIQIMITSIALVTPSQKAATRICQTIRA